MANKFNLRTFLRASVLFLSLAGLVQAGTITVGPGAGYDFETIQAGIDAVVDGDTVLVAPGEYVITEPITFRGKAITVKSEAGPEQTTIRMGTPADPKQASVVVFDNNETAASVLDGFTITGGTGYWLWFPEASKYTWCGGGIYFNGCSGTVRNCTIVQNDAKYAAAGVLAYDMSFVTLINCTIANNTAEGVAGGVSCSYGSSVIMNNCTIADNTAGISVGGVGCAYGSSLTMTDCVIRGNSATTESGGGVLCWENSSVNMTYCTIAENSAASIGGGVLCGENSSSVNMAHCVIISNTARIGGGGLETFHQASATVSNCVIAWNTALQLGGGGIVCAPYGFPECSATVTNSIMWGNTAPTGSEIWVRSGARFSISHSNLNGGQAGVNVEGGSTLDWGEGNIDADPLFARLGYWDDKGTRDTSDDIWVEGDYHLKSESGRYDPNSNSWIADGVTSPCIDAGDPNTPVGDEPEPNGGIINMGAYGGTAEASMSPAGAEEIVYIQWLGHSTVKVWTEAGIIYVDPERVPEALHDADLVCVTHTHGDHYSPADIAKVTNAQTQFIGPPDVIQQYGSGQTIAPGQTIEFDFVNVTAVPAYNTNKSNHPKSNNWVGYILELGGKRIYVAGDTDLIEEMKSLGEIDVAILPAGGTYTMNAVEAAEATQYIKPKLAIPYHWGQNVGTLADAQRFAELARCAVKILAVGETIASNEWPEYQPLIAHWALDETEGAIASDSVGEHDGTLYGDPVWQPAGGKIAGALQLDGVDDYVSVPFVLDPAEGVFSAFAWVKSEVVGSAVLSQQDGTGTGYTWLGADLLQGNLISGLVPPPAGRTVTPALESPFLITDGQWHHVGFVWDGQRRHLFADGVEVAVDAGTIDPLTSSDGGMHIGADKSLEVDSFFSGLIDDVRVYEQAVNQ